jgi:predicted adenylyl cyclase CyaB
VPTELEAKFRVATHDDLRRRLSELGAVRRGVYLETNLLFDLPDASLRTSGKGLRVRRVETLEGAPAVATLTFKGPRRPGPLKDREEIETAIDDPSSACAILMALGFEENLLFEKRRETWRLDDVSVELDTLPTLGRFVEIEGPHEAAIQAARQKLGLAATELVADTYVSMLAALGGGQRPMRFFLSGRHDRADE